MEIKNIDNNEQNAYPKEEQIEEKKIKKSIPNGWKVIGGTVIMVGLVFGGKMIYDNIQNQEKYDIAGFLTQEVQLFNYQFSPYEGKQSGSNVKALLESVASSNIQWIEFDDRLISVVYNNNKIMIINNDQDSLKQFINEINDLKKNVIKKEKNYMVLVKTSSETELVNEVEIQELEE